MRRLISLLSAASLLFAAAPFLHAQEEGRPGGGFASMQRAGGEVTAVDGATLTVKGEDGAVYKIVTTDNTRVVRGNGAMMGGGMGMRRGEGGSRPEGAGAPQTIKVADIKVGDGLMAAGMLDAPNRTLHAAMVFDTDAAALKAARENFGKTYITGRVTAIDVDKPSLTLERPDHVTQTIGLDESTSFRRMARGRRGVEGSSSPATSAPPAGESITLADIQVGDQVSGHGALKNGVFVPTELMVGHPRPPRAENNAPATSTPPAR